MVLTEGKHRTPGAAVAVVTTGDDGGDGAWDVAARLAAYAAALAPRLRRGLGRRARLVRPLRRPGRTGRRRPDDGHADGAPRRAATTPGASRRPPTGSPSAAAGYRLALADPTFVPGTPGELRFTVTRPGRTAGHRVRTHRARPAPAARRRRAPRRRGLPAPRPDHGPGRHLAHPADAARARGLAGLRRHRPRPADRRSCSAPTCSRAGPFAPFTFPPSRVAADRRLPAPAGRRPGAGRAVAGLRDRQPRRRGRHRPAALPRRVRQARRAPRRATSPTPPPRPDAPPPAPTDRAGPAVAFTANVPSAGTYRLFLQFRVADVMHTAEFTVPTRNP